MKTAAFVMILGAIAIPFIAVGDESEIKLCRMDERNRQAIEYVGTRPTGGRVQLRLLEMEGLQKED